MISKRRLAFALLSWHNALWSVTAIIVCAYAAHYPWTSPWFYLTLLAIYVAYYFVVAARQVTVHTTGSGMDHRILNRIKCVHGWGYWPAPLLLDANLQTFFAAIGRPDAGVKYHRELVSGIYTDGETAVVDWSYAHGQAYHSDSNPVVILFHGLTAGTDDANTHYLTRFMNAAGWHVVIPVRRGCAEVEGMSRGKHYDYGNVEDTQCVISYISHKMAGHPLFGLGISAGSNVMCNYLGLVGKDSKLLGGISVANGYCWEKGTAAIRDEHPVWDVIMSGLVHHNLNKRHTTISNKLEGAPEKLAFTPDTPVVEHKKVSSMRQFDEAYSRRLHGFDSLADYYRAQSCEHRIPNITVPVIFLNALDDPLASYMNIPYETLKANPQTMLVTTTSGGHLGWADGLWPFSDRETWLDKFVVQGMRSLIEETVTNRIAQAVSHSARLVRRNSSVESLMSDSPTKGQRPMSRHSSHEDSIAGMVRKYSTEARMDSIGDHNLRYRQPM